MVRGEHQICPHLRVFQGPAGFAIGIDVPTQPHAAPLIAHQQHTAHGVGAHATSPVGAVILARGVDQLKAHTIPLPLLARHAAALGEFIVRAQPARLREGLSHRGRAASVVAVGVTDDHGVQTLAHGPHIGQDHPLPGVGLRPITGAGVVEQGVASGAHHDRAALPHIERHHLKLTHGWPLG